MDGLVSEYVYIRRCKDLYRPLFISAAAPTLASYDNILSSRLRDKANALRRRNCRRERQLPDDVDLRRGILVILLRVILDVIAIAEEPSCVLSVPLASVDGRFFGVCTDLECRSVV